jgi:hypothetical protein
MPNKNLHAFIAYCRPSENHFLLHSDAIIIGCYLVETSNCGKQAFLMHNFCICINLQGARPTSLHSSTNQHIVLINREIDLKANHTSTL